MKNNILFFFLMSLRSLCFGDSLFYDITVYGIKCGEISFYNNQNSELKIKTHSIGLINYFFPFDNEYNVNYDSSSFNMINYSKTIKQGQFKQTLFGVWDHKKNKIKYEGHVDLPRTNPSLTILSFLTMIRQVSKNELDTKWFPIEHEGKLFKSRVLFSDSVNLDYNGSSILCNHFRLDLIPDSKKKILDQSDYFNNNIVRSDAIRQLWVENLNKKRILKASVKIGFIEVVAILK